MPLIAADSGMEWFMRNREFIPDLAVGDFDSLSEEGKKYMETLCNGLKIIRLKPEKDDSDTQSAVNHMISERKQRELLIFGATGNKAGSCAGQSRTACLWEEKKECHIVTCRSVELHYPGRQWNSFEKRRTVWKICVLSLQLEGMYPG